MVDDLVRYTHEAQMDGVVDYLSKIDLTEKTLKIDVEGELLPYFISDMENFPLLIRQALRRYLFETLRANRGYENLEKEKLLEECYDLANAYNIVLESKIVKKVSDVLIKKIPQFCDVVILGIGPREIYSVREAFKCIEGCIIKVDVEATREGKKMDDNFKCDEHNKTYFRKPDLDDEDLIARIVIQEPFRDAKNSTPIDYDARIVGQMVRETYVGQKKRVFITPRGLSKITKGKTSEKKLLFDVLSIADLEEEKKLFPSNKEIEEYRKSAQNPDYFNKMIESFAPNVIGESLKWVKKGLLLALIGGSRVDDGRGDINLLMVGDPSVAKSSLLEYCAEITQKAILTTGKGSSAAGLTIGMVKRHDGTMMAQPGILPLCHKGVALIDEFDKMNDIDRDGMHQAMEQQKVTISKAGTNLTLPAETTVIAASNPAFSRWNENLPFRENVKFPYTLLSRFDLKYLMLDTHDYNVDAIVGSKIFTKYGEVQSTFFSKLQFLSMINYAKTLRPRMSDEARDLLLVTWQNIRQKIKNEEIRADTRTLEGLIRLATAHAKLHFKDFVDIHDAKTVIELYKFSLRTFGIDADKEGEQTHFYGDQREMNQHETFWMCFETAKDEQGTVSKQEVIDLMKDTKKFTPLSAEIFFNKLASGANQQLILDKNERYRRIS